MNNFLPSCRTRVPNMITVTLAIFSKEPPHCFQWQNPWHNRTSCIHGMLMASLQIRTRSPTSIGLPIVTDKKAHETEEQKKKGKKRRFQVADRACSVMIFRFGLGICEIPLVKAIEGKSLLTTTKWTKQLACLLHWNYASCHDMNILNALVNPLPLQW